MLACGDYALIEMLDLSGVSRPSTGQHQVTATGCIWGEIPMVGGSPAPGVAAFRAQAAVDTKQRGQPKKIRSVILLGFTSGMTPKREASGEPIQTHGRVTPHSTDPVRNLACQQQP